MFLDSFYGKFPLAEWWYLVCPRALAYLVSVPGHTDSVGDGFYFRK